MKEKELIKQLQKKTVFSVQDVERIGNFSREYSKLVLNRLVKRGDVFRITKNAYTLHKDAFLISSNIATPSYISFWSASSYYGFTDQILNTIYVAVTRKVKNINFLGYRIIFLKLDNFFGYHKIKNENGEIFIADPEKLLIDAVDKQNKMGNFDEIINVFEKSDISRSKMLEYLKRTKKLSLIKRVCYLLDKIKKIDFLGEFEIDKNYTILDKLSKKDRGIDKKWRIRL
jgi:predicted transcriptional regulator of viral defense system